MIFGSISKFVRDQTHPIAIPLVVVVNVKNNSASLHNQRWELFTIESSPETSDIFTLLEMFKLGKNGPGSDWCHWSLECVGVCSLCPNPVDSAKVMLFMGSSGMLSLFFSNVLSRPRPSSSGVSLFAS